VKEENSEYPFFNMLSPPPSIVEEKHPFFRRGGGWKVTTLDNWTGRHPLPFDREEDLNFYSAKGN